MKKNTLWNRHLPVVIACLLLVALDQLTKHMAVIYLKDQPAISLIPGVFQLQYLENRGAAFGFFQNKQLFFLVGTVLVLLVVLYFYARIPYQKRYALMKCYLVLLISGALGNLIDRVRFQYVVDFFYFSLIDFPIFNVADCYVVVACILFAFSILFYYTEEELSVFSLRKRT